MASKTVEVDLSEFTDDELQDECEARHIWPQVSDPDISDFSTEELADELAERGDGFGEIDCTRLYDWLRDVPNVPSDIRDMVFAATGRILP
jgi:hypothetical protein